MIRLLFKLQQKMKISVIFYQKKKWFMPNHFFFNIEEKEF